MESNDINNEGNKSQNDIQVLLEKQEIQYIDSFSRGTERLFKNRCFDDPIAKLSKPIDNELENDK